MSIEIKCDMCGDVIDGDYATININNVSKHRTPPKQSKDICLDCKKKVLKLIEK